MISQTVRAVVKSGQARRVVSGHSACAARSMAAMSAISRDLGDSRVSQPCYSRSVIVVPVPYSCPSGSR